MTSAICMERLPKEGSMGQEGIISHLWSLRNNTISNSEHELIVFITICFFKQEMNADIMCY